MRLSSHVRTIVVLAAACACLLPAAGCGRKKASLTIAQRLKKARAEKVPEKKARDLVKVARVQFNSQDRLGAAGTLREARAAVPDSGDAFERGKAFVEIAGMFAELGEKPTAKDVVAKAVAAAAACEDPVNKATLQSQIAAVQGSKTAGLGDPATARRTLAEARKVAESVDERFRAKALAAVATGGLGAGLLDEAGALVEALEQSARGLEEKLKVEALVAAANVHAQRSDSAAAMGLLEEAAKEAKAIGKAETRTYALLEVAQATNAAGDGKRAAALLRDAEKAANKVGDATQQKIALEKVLAAQADVGRK